MASRDYGTAESPLALGLKPAPVGDILQISVLAKPRQHGPREDEVTVQIDEQTPLKSTVLGFDGTNPRARVLRIAIPIASVAALRNAKRLSIKSRSELDASFELGPIGKLMDQLDRCVADLKQVWNVDPPEQLKLRARAEANLAKYLKDEDYPLESLLKGETGTVGFALLINEAGKVADCTLTQTSNVPFLDAQTCALLSARAKFSPAVSSDGKPAKDAQKGRVRWVTDEKPEKH